MKIMYRKLTEIPTNTESINAASLQQVELGLPTDLEAMLMDRLELLNQQLPASIRHFLDWKVVYLP